MMGPQRRLGINIGYDSPSIIKYFEPSTSDLFTAPFVESVFSNVRGRKKETGKGYWLE